MSYIPGCYGVRVRQAEKDTSDLIINGVLEFRRVIAASPSDALRIVKDWMYDFHGAKVVRAGDRNSIWVEKSEYFEKHAHS